MDERDNLIDNLLMDYEDYLRDFKLEEIKEIINSGHFTLREARDEKQA